MNFAREALIYHGSLCTSINCAAYRMMVVKDVEELGVGDVHTMRNSMFLAGTALRLSCLWMVDRMLY